MVVISVIDGWWTTEACLYVGVSSRAKKKKQPQLGWTNPLFVALLVPNGTRLARLVTSTGTGVQHSIHARSNRSMKPTIRKFPEWDTLTVDSLGVVLVITGQHYIHDQLINLSTIIINHYSESFCVISHNLPAKIIAYNHDFLTSVSSWLMMDQTPRFFTNAHHQSSYANNYDSQGPDELMKLNETNAY